MQNTTVKSTWVIHPQKYVRDVLRLLMAAAFICMLAPVSANAQMTEDDLNDLAPNAGPLDAKLNTLGLHIADYRIDADDAAKRLVAFMQENPDHEIVRMYNKRLAYGGYIGLDREEALADAIAEARKNLYLAPGMSTLYASNRVFTEVARALQNSSYKLIGITGIGVLLALGVMIGMIRGGLSSLSGKRRRHVRRVPANTDMAPTGRKEA